MTRQHATRTCHFCGIRAPQPEMIRDQIYAESGQSKSSITGATILGAAAGSRSAKRALERTVFGAANRTYLRKKEIWRCDAANCREQAGAAARDSRKSKGIPIWLGVVIVIVVLALMAGNGTTP
jgi:hypothetical protein